MFHAFTFWHLALYYNGRIRNNSLTPGFLSACGLQPYNIRVSFGSGVQISVATTLVATSYKSVVAQFMEWKPQSSNMKQLVGGYTYLPLWKMMEWKSVGMRKFPTEWKVIKFHGSKSPSTLFHVISDSKNSNTGTELLRNLSMADFKHRTSIVGRQKSPSPGKKNRCH